MMMTIAEYDEAGTTEFSNEGLLPPEQGSLFQIIVAAKAGEQG